MNPSKLVAGRIPAGTVCPFRSECGSAANGDCKHRGTDHTVDFSCGYARGWNLVQQYEKVDKR